MTKVGFIFDIRKKLIYLNILDSKLLYRFFQKIVFKEKIDDEIIIRNHKNNKLYLLESIIICYEIKLTKTWPNMIHV